MLVYPSSIGVDPIGTLSWNTSFVPLGSVWASGTAVFSGFRPLLNSFALKCSFGSATIGPPTAPLWKCDGTSAARMH